MSEEQVVKFAAALEIVRNAVSAPTLEAAFEAILTSGWDFTDKHVKMPPDEVEDVLCSFSFRATSYAELKQSNEKAARLVAMVFDAFCRAARAHTRAVQPM
jgi:hypothetical protein